MDVRLSMQVLAGVCGLVLLILIMKKKAQFFLNFLVRVGVGAAMIMWVNSILLPYTAYTYSKNSRIEDQIYDSFLSKRGRS